MSGYSAPEILDIEFDLSKSYSDLSKEKKHVVDMFSVKLISNYLAWNDFISTCYRITSF